MTLSRRELFTVSAVGAADGLAEPLVNDVQTMIGATTEAAARIVEGLAK